MAISPLRFGGRVGLQGIRRRRIPIPIVLRVSHRDGRPTG